MLNLRSILEAILIALLKSCVTGDPLLLLREMLLDHHFLCEDFISETHGCKGFTRQSKLFFDFRSWKFMCLLNLLSTLNREILRPLANTIKEGRVEN